MYGLCTPSIYNFRSFLPSRPLYNTPAFGMLTAMPYIGRGCFMPGMFGSPYGSGFINSFGIGYMICSTLGSIYSSYKNCSYPSYFNCLNTYNYSSINPFANNYAYSYSNTNTNYYNNLFTYTPSTYSSSQYRFVYNPYTPVSSYNYNFSYIGSSYNTGTTKSSTKNNKSSSTGSKSKKTSSKSSSYWEKLGYNAEKGLALAKDALSHAVGFVGYCARYVKKAIYRTGLGTYQQGDACDMISIMRKNKNFKEISPNSVNVKNLPAGCVIVYARGAQGYSSKYGHTEITTGDGRAVSDGITKNLYKKPTAIFIPISA